MSSRRALFRVLPSDFKSSSAVVYLHSHFPGTDLNLPKAGARQSPRHQTFPCSGSLFLQRGILRNFGANGGQRESRVALSHSNPRSYTNRAPAILAIIPRDRENQLQLQSFHGSRRHLDPRLRFNNHGSFPRLRGQKISIGVRKVQAHAAPSDVSAHPASFQKQYRTF